jgi:hypothetical protein
MSILQDGSGRGNSAKVDGNQRLRTQSISESEEQHAAEQGDAYNINTGDVTCNDATNSAVLYFYNDEDQDVIVESVAIGLRGAGNAFDSNEQNIITLRRNDDAGTIVSGAAAVDMNQNRNFGSSKTLKSTSLAYKGATGNTSTGGEDIAQFYMSGNGRLFASINFVVSKGSSISIMINPNVTTSCVAYAALILHVKDAESAD